MRRLSPAFEFWLGIAGIIIFVIVMLLIIT
jgi:hypothetical protein